MLTTKLGTMCSRGPNENGSWPTHEAMFPFLYVSFSQFNISAMAISFFSPTAFTHPGRCILISRELVKVIRFRTLAPAKKKKTLQTQRTYNGAFRSKICLMRTGKAFVISAWTFGSFALIIRASESDMFSIFITMVNPWIWMSGSFWKHKLIHCLIIKLTP